MTPRTVMATLSADTTIAELSPTDPALAFSRIPLFLSDEDDIIGFARKDDIYRTVVEGNSQSELAELKRDLLSVLETKSLPDLMQEMVAERTSMSLVVNEYGDPLGIATMEDLVETLLGMEIVDESDSHIDMQERARELWRLRARTAGLNTDAINTPDAE